ncbi:MAG: hypothetical protein HRT89_06180, partial [Lentisphaeria bacterium]|nr:hypothetical protein [Lentisphaeria bacterium]NQZ67640.1 hypothetical protein [Lentisphaeria bacterium]
MKYLSIIFLLFSASAADKAELIIRLEKNIALTKAKIIKSDENLKSLHFSIMRQQRKLEVEIYKNPLIKKLGIINTAEKEKSFFEQRRKMLEKNEYLASLDKQLLIDRKRMDNLLNAKASIKVLNQR